MAQSAGLHEPEDLLSPQAIDRHRAITSIQEELEAVDWYDQRVEATTNSELAGVLAHNRDGHLRTYLFTEGSILATEDAATEGDVPQSGSLGIGDLRAH
jgi:hypothetical protein